MLTATFESLGIVEKERKVFISYRQADASEVAIQLHDELVKRRFNVFLDKFVTSPPDNIQELIDEALEDIAFVLLLYSPDSHNSRWVDWEITRALKSTLPVLVIKWTNIIQGVSKIEETNFPTIEFDPQRDTVGGKMRGPKVEEILASVEQEHKEGLVRRRREAIDTAKVHARRKGFRVDELPGWKLKLTKQSGLVEPTVMAITPRLIRGEDLYSLDRMPVSSSAGGNVRRILIQVSTELPRLRRNFLDWIIDGRTLILVQGLNSLEGVL